MRRLIPHCPTKTTPRRRGVVLIVVMVLVVMVALAGFGFLVSMSTEYEAARLNGDLFQAHQVMASAETYVLAMARKGAAPSADTDDFSMNSQLAPTGINNGQNPWWPQEIRPVRAIGDQHPNPGRDNRWRFAIVSGLPGEQSSSPVDSLIPPQTETSDASTGSLQFGLKNESSKLHLKMILDRETVMPGEGRRMLMQIPNMTPEAADGILDWIDPDDERREFGAEASDYATSENAGGPRNAVPERLEELLFVQGVQRSAFEGPRFSAGGFAEEPPGWLEHLTVWSAEGRVNHDGRPRTNLNASAQSTNGRVSEDELFALSPQQSTGSGDGLPTELPEDVQRFVQLGVVHGFVDDPTGSDSVMDIDVPDELSDPEFDPIAVESLAALIDVTVQLPQSVGGLRVASPLQTTDPNFAERFRIVEETATVESGDVIIGRVNIHLAPASALRAIIDDPAIAERIVQERKSLDASELKTTVWLLSKQIVDLSTYRNIYPSITAGGDVSTGELIVYRRRGGPFLRRRITVDASHRPARRLDWSNLTNRRLPVPVSALRPPSGDL